MENYIDETNFDIDNRDIEEEMERADIEQEAIDQEEENEKIAAETFEKEVKTKRLQLNSKNLDEDLKYEVEDDRKRYKFKMPDGTKYEGFAIYKFDKDNYLMSVKEIGKTEYKSIKFKISELKQIK